MGLINVRLAQLTIIFELLVYTFGVNGQNKERIPLNMPLTWHLTQCSLTF